MKFLFFKFPYLVQHSDMSNVRLNLDDTIKINDFRIKICCTSGKCIPFENRDINGTLSLILSSIECQNRLNICRESKSTMKAYSQVFQLNMR